MAKRVRSLAGPGTRRRRKPPERGAIPRRRAGLRAKAAGRPALAVVPPPEREPARDAAPGRDVGDCRERIERVKTALYDLHAELVHFTGAPVEQRERLRRAMSWSDVGHITSLARALADEDRFADWVRFNRCVDRLVKSA